MTTLTNSEGKALIYEFIETILLQLNPSSNYYTTGDNDLLFIKIGSNKVLVLNYIYHINRTIFQNYTINENSLNKYDLELMTIITIMIMIRGRRRRELVIQLIILIILIILLIITVIVVVIVIIVIVLVLVLIIPWVALSV